MRNYDFFAVIIIGWLGAFLSSIYMVTGYVQVDVPISTWLPIGLIAGLPYVGLAGAFTLLYHHERRLELEHKERKVKVD